MKVVNEIRFFGVKIGKVGSGKAEGESMENNGVALRALVNENHLDVEHARGLPDGVYVPSLMY